MLIKPAKCFHLLVLLMFKECNNTHAHSQWPQRSHSVSSIIPLMYRVPMAYML